MRVVARSSSRVVPPRRRRRCNRRGDTCSAPHHLSYVRRRRTCFWRAISRGKPRSLAGHCDSNPLRVEAPDHALSQRLLSLSPLERSVSSSQSECVSRLQGRGHQSHHHPAPAQEWEQWLRSRLTFIVRVGRIFSISTGSLALSFIGCSPPAFASNSRRSFSSHWESLLQSRRRWARHYTST